jgi:hypothetical protein
MCRHLGQMHSCSSRQERPVLSSVDYSIIQGGNIIGLSNGGKKGLEILLVVLRKVAWLEHQSRPGLKRLGYFA